MATGMGGRFPLPGTDRLQLAPPSVVAITDPAAVHTHACVESSTNMSFIGDAMNCFDRSGTGVHVQLTPSEVDPVYNTPLFPPAIAVDWLSMRTIVNPGNGTEISPRPLALNSVKSVGGGFKALYAAVRIVQPLAPIIPHRSPAPRGLYRRGWPTLHPYCPSALRHPGCRQASAEFRTRGLCSAWDPCRRCRC